jgi:predicted transcriptional regulator
MNLNTIWSTLMESAERLSDFALDKAFAELNLEPGNMTWLWAIVLFDTEPFSTAAYMRIRPYGSERVNEARFASAVKRNILSVNTQNEYLATEKGKDFMVKFMRAGDASITHLHAIPTSELQKIADHVKRLVDASFAAPEPPSQLGMTRYYKNIHPGQDAQLLRLVLHYVASLSQYRDASHLASWQDYNIAGYVWSALTSIWRDEANTLDALHEEMGPSVFTRKEISQALHDLTTRGWIEDEAGRYQTTAEGNRIRQQAEDLTDELFFKPWICLNESEQEDLLNLATQLRDGLKDLG